MQEILKALSEPFDFVYERDGRRDRDGNIMVWKYIPVAYVVKRLNEVVGVGWSAHVVESIIDDGYILKRVRLEIDDPNGTGKTYIREGEGSHKLSLTPDPGDAHKSAFSKALTKAASLFGIGLYLSMPDEDEVPEEYQDEVNGHSVPVPEPEPERNGAVEKPSYTPSTFKKPPVYGRPIKDDAPSESPVMGGKSLGNGAGTPVVKPKPLSVKGFSPTQGQAATVKAQLHVQSPDGNSATKFQINAIQAGAGRLGRDPLEIASEILETQLQSLDELTFETAGKVMGTVKELAYNAGK